MRLDKFVAATTCYSRSQVKKAVKAGVIYINHQVATDAAQCIRPSDTVCLEGQTLSMTTPRYFMLNKPQGVICATQDSEHPTVIDLLLEANTQSLHIAGRLNKDTTGPVLITDDGKWSHTITSPNKKCFKHYRAHLTNPLSQKAAQQLQQGVQLNREPYPTRPAKLKIITPNDAQLAIQEGKCHQVKRMFAAVGNHVIALHRYQIGHIQLDSTLAPGAYKPLSQQDIECV